MSKKSKDQSTVRKAITRGRHARGIGPRPLVCTRRHLRSFAQGLVLITLSLYRSQHFALYAQGRIPDASGLGLANQVALYVQGFGSVALRLEGNEDFALYVQGRVQDASGLGLTKQVALYVQGLVLITNSLDRRQHFALYVQGRMQDASGETQPARLACSSFGSGLAPAINSPCMYKVAFI